MWKKNKRYVIVSTLITLLPILMGLALWDRLPDTLATHFNFAGEADGWSSKTFAVVGLPLFLAGLHLICVLGTLADPRKQNISDKMFRLVLCICPVVSILVGGSVYLYGLGISMNISRIAMILVGILFIVIGNYLPKCRQNYTVGVKTPWALADVENWNKTHRMAGWLWMVAGVIMLGAAILKKLNLVLFFVLIIVVSLAPMIYSYWYYVTHNKE